MAYLIKGGYLTESRAYRTVRCRRGCSGTSVFSSCWWRLCWWWRFCNQCGNVCVCTVGTAPRQCTPVFCRAAGSFRIVGLPPLDLHLFLLLLGSLPLPPPPPPPPWYLPVAVDFLRVLIHAGLSGGLGYGNTSGGWNSLLII